MVYFQYLKLWKETGKTTNLLDGYRFAGKKNSNLHYIETDLLCLLRHEMSLIDIVIQRVNGELHFNNQPLYFSTLLCIHIKKTTGLYYFFFSQK